MVHLTIESWRFLKAPLFLKQPEISVFKSPPSVPIASFVTHRGPAECA